MVGSAPVGRSAPALNETNPAVVPPCTKVRSRTTSRRFETDTKVGRTTRSPSWNAIGLRAVFQTTGPSSPARPRFSRSQRPS